MFEESAIAGSEENSEVRGRNEKEWVRNVAKRRKGLKAKVTPAQE